ncbi:MAG TPA: glycosyltransferase family 4 protein [Polyangia bacterium]|nr:glycosyltransferase family 4 protein [Polyangia bacterium]
MEDPTDGAPGIWVVMDLVPNKRGSLEQGVLALAARLQTVHANSTFVFATPPAEWLSSALDERGVTTRILDFRRPAVATIEFAKWLRAAPPTLVHFHFVRAHSPLVLMAHATGARTIVHEHITLGQAVPPYRDHSPRVKSLLRPLKRLRAATIGRWVDARLAVSVFVAASVIDAEHFPSERIEVIPNGVDISRFLKADANALRWELKIGPRPLVACVSRMSREKGVDILIRAIARVRDDVALVIAGNGADMEKCKQLAHDLGVSDRVYFLGLRDDVENVYAAANVVVMPSLWDEAFGLCVVEAMAAGRPVVVTDSGAMPEIIANGDCGAVVPKADDVAMAAAISALLDNPERAAKVGNAARQRAITMYPIEKWVDALIKAYSRLVPMIQRRDSVVVSFDDFAPGAEKLPQAASSPMADAASGERTAIG